MDNLASHKVAGVKEAVRTERKVGILLQRQPDIDDPTPADLHAIGTLCKLESNTPGDTGSHQIVVTGLARFRLAAIEDR